MSELYRLRKKKFMKKWGVHEKGEKFMKKGEQEKFRKKGGINTKGAIQSVCLFRVFCLNSAKYILSR